MKVENNRATTIEPLKYAYHTNSHNSTIIMLEVKNIAPTDAGFYGAGTTETDARSRPGVFLVVRGKPTKPEIKGNMTVSENSDVTLTCASNSTSRPAYYSKTVSLTYIWYKNNSVISSETGKYFNILGITKDDRFNKYSCQSKETIESEKSDEIQINVSYGPNNIIIRPQLPVNNTLSVKDGDYIGPYNCSADCNPPCSIQWKYKLSAGGFEDAESDGGTLQKQQVVRDQKLFRCVAKTTAGNKSLADIILHIMYLSKPVWTVNGQPEKIVNMDEREYLNISCAVDGKPTPTLNISRRTQESILKTKSSNEISYQKRAQCDDTDIYKCTASSTGFDNNHTEVTVNVTCTIRIDTEDGFKYNYGSTSGSDVKVNVTVPVISNPKPSAKLITWSGPTSSNIRNDIINDVKERDVIYKHWINSTIPVNNDSCFGNYTMKYNSETIVTIIIKAEDKPKPPLNFNGYSYSSGYINLTWISGFNGGPEQFFILSRKGGSGWIEVANITDPGEGQMGYYDTGRLNPGHEYWYRLQSCNRINCSFPHVDVNVTVPESPIHSASPSSSNDSIIPIVIGGAGGLLVLIIVVVVVVICCRKKKSKQQGPSQERVSVSFRAAESPQPEAIEYAVVDKSLLLKNRKQAEEAADDASKDKNDEKGVVYADTKPSTSGTTKGSKKKKSKGGNKKSPDGAKKTTGADDGNAGSRTVNQDGLVYVDVDFAKKPESSGTNANPVIHGEEFKTEYTFVDFSKKAPPMQETEDDEDAE